MRDINMNCPYLIYDIVYIEENNDEFEILDCDLLSFKDGFKNCLTCPLYNNDWFLIKNIL